MCRVQTPAALLPLATTTRVTLKMSLPIFSSECRSLKDVKICVQTLMSRFLWSQQRTLGSNEQGLLAITHCEKEENVAGAGAIGW